MPHLVGKTKFTYQKKVCMNKLQQKIFSKVKRWINNWIAKQVPLIAAIKKKIVK